MAKNCIFFLLFFLPFLGKAQFPDEGFGKSRVQQKKLDWKVLDFNNLNVLYYENKVLAEQAGHLAETMLPEITSFLNFTPSDKIRIVLYASPNDLAQSNIGISDPEYLTQGNPSFLKLRAEVAYKGSQYQLSKDIQKGLYNTLLNNMLYGGSIKEVLQSAYFLSLPEWFISGIVNTLCAKQSLEMENFIRAALLLQGKLKNPIAYKGRDAALVGQSIWDYFLKEYGEKEIESVINYIRVVKNYRAAIEASTGISYKQFIANWKACYMEKEKPVFETSDTLPAPILKRKNNTSLALSSSELAALASNTQNRVKVELIDSLSERPTVLNRSGKKIPSLANYKAFPVLHWKNDKILIALNTDKKGFFFKLFNVESKTSAKQRITGLDYITDFSISENGDVALLAASRKNQSDLFLYSFQNNSLRQLTNDPYDEINPAFITNVMVAFSSTKPTKPSSEEDFFKLYIKPISGKDTLMSLYIPGSTTKPLFNNGFLYFLNDQTGVRALYRTSLQTKETVQITHYPLNIENYSLTDHSLFFTTRSNKATALYYIPHFSPHITNPKTDVFSPFSSKKEQDQASFTEKEETIDINNYVFESEKIKQKDTPDSTTKKSPNIPKEKTPLTYSSYRYKNRFTIEGIAANALIDPLRGLGILMQASMSDILENHKIRIGIFGLANLKSSNVFGVYDYLQRRIDWQLKYSRKTLIAVTNFTNEKYALNNLQISASYPFDYSKKFILSPFIASTKYTPLDIASTPFSTGFPSDSTTFYFGIKESFVFDNTVSTAINIRKGIRAKISLSSYLSPEKAKSFGKFLTDIRGYLPIYKNITLASRASLGAFLGKSPKNFLLGGMNNWFFNKTNISPENDPLLLAPFQNNSQLMFLDFVTPMRGFNYNTQFGEKFVVFNAALRIPITSIFSTPRITSSFFKNIQLVGFTDIGMAWSGKNPLSKENSLNRIVIKQDKTPFSAVVYNYRKPYLIGYGFGIRTVLLGIFVKGDIAWGILDNKVQDNKVYLTLGYDF